MQITINAWRYLCVFCVELRVQFVMVPQGHWWFSYGCEFEATSTHNAVITPGWNFKSARGKRKKTFLLCTSKRELFLLASFVLRHPCRCLVVAWSSLSLACLSLKTKHFSQAKGCFCFCAKQKELVLGAEICFDFWNLTPFGLHFLCASERPWQPRVFRNLEEPQWKQHPLNATNTNDGYNGTTRWSLR